MLLKNKRDGIKVLYNERLLYGNLWVEVNGSLASVGITKEFERSIGDIIIFEFIKRSGYIQQGDEFARIETINNLYSLISPISGIIRNANTRLVSDPTILNLLPEETEILSVDISALL